MGLNLIAENQLLKTNAIEITEDVSWIIQDLSHRI